LNLAVIIANAHHIVAAFAVGVAAKDLYEAAILEHANNMRARGGRLTAGQRHDQKENQNPCRHSS
jgi:hypothetical protein